MPVAPLRYVDRWAFAGTSDGGWHAILECGHIKSVRRARALREQKRDEVQMRCERCREEVAA